MKKRLVSLLLTVVMIVSLVPFSAISAFATDATAGTAAALDSALKAASSGETVTLTDDVTDTAQAYTMNPGVTLDLNGHKFAYKSIETKEIGARVIDSAAGEYEIYEFITANGRQFISTGLGADEVSGFNAAFRLLKPVAENTPNVLFGGFRQDTIGGTKRTFRFEWSTNQQSANSLDNFKSTSTSFYAPWLTHDGYSANSVTSQALYKLGADGVDEYKLFSLPENIVTVDSVVRNGYQGTTFNGCIGPKALVTKDWTLFDRDTYNIAMNLLNTSGPAQGSWDTMTQKSSFQWNQLTDQEVGRAGWVGELAYAKIYSDPGTTFTTNDDTYLVRDFVPAKSKTTGMIGMFDKAEGVFYPLLGIVNLASVRDYTSLLTLKSNGSFTEKRVIVSAPGLNSALNNAKSGDTVKIDADITDNTVSYTIPAGVTLDLNGHTITYKALEVKAEGARVIDSTKGEYKLYDYIYTNGTEFITTGVSSLTVSGIKATFTMDQPYPDTGNRHLFGGYYTGGTDRIQFIATDGQSAANKGSTENNTSGIRGGWICNSAGSAEVAMTVDGYRVASGSVSANNLGKKFDLDVHLNSDGFTATSAGAVDKTGSKANGVFTRTGKTQFNMVLLNMANATYSNMTTVGTQWPGYSNDKTGRLGWVGKTYSASIYENEVDGNVVATRDYIPAEAPNGAIGMFDKVEGVFYPLLGTMTYASLGEAIGTATINEDGIVTIKTLIKTADDLKSALASAKSGDTVKIDAAIDASSDDIVLPSGIKLDLNGYKLTANSFTATDADALIDNSAESTGRVQVIDTFSCPNGDFAYELDDTKTYKVVESLAHKLSRKDAKHKLAEDFSDTATAYTLAEGVELDLNGHKFSVKSLDAAKGTVIDSTLDILSSAETAKVNCSKGSVVVTETNGFTYAATNPLVVVDNKDNTYNLRKLAVTYLPGSVTGWTLAAPSFDAGTSKYIEYWSYGEKITLAKMVYTADGASISWKQDDKTFTPGAKYAAAITEDIEFTAEMKMVEVDSTAYNSWADAVAAIKDNSAVTIYGTVKLTEDLTNATVTYTFGEGGTLDLNGHKFAYKTVDTKAIGSRIIDSATGMYEFYDHITTTGKQFIATGLSIKTGVTGLSAKTMSRRENGSTGWTYFVGAGLTKTTNTGTTYYDTDYWFPLAMNAQGKTDNVLDPKKGSGLQARFTYNNLTEGFAIPQGSTYPVVNCKDWSSAWNTPAKNMGGINPGDTFTWDYICNTGVQKVSINGTSLLNQTNSKFTYPPVDIPDVNVMLFNRSGAKWADMTQTADYYLFASDADTYDKIGDGTYGRLGWDGNTERATFYCDPAGTATNTNKVRDFVPAKSVATGMIGMYDQVEGVFYPLLGNVEYAQMGNLIDIRTKRADKTLYTVSASDASELSSVLSGIQSGETVYMLKDIDVDGDVTIPVGVTLDLGGHRLSAANVTADSTQSAYIIDHTYEGGVTVSGTFSYGAGHEDYHFATSDSKVYTVKSNWVTRLAKAKSGEVIKLTEMLEDDRDFVLGEDAILDLNGLTMKVKSFDASKGQVIDSTLDILSSAETAKVNSSKGSVIVAEGEEFKFAATNPLVVIDNKDNTYNLRKYEITYLPGDATGWTLGGAFDASTSKYVEYTTYGETITLAKMVYTADGAYISWVRDDASFTPGAKYATTITEDIEFSTELKLADVDGKAYLSWAEAVAAIKNDSKVTIYGNVKLTENLTNTTVTYTLDEYSTLDLNGHKFAYKAVDTKAIGSRIIDSATGTYEFYDYLFTTGRQFIPLGIRPSELSGADAEMTVDVAVYSTAPNAFLGGHNGSTARFQVISTGYGDSTSMYCWVCDTNGDSNGKTNSSPDYKDKLGQKFGMSFRLAADRKITVEYTGALAKAATTSDYTVFTPDTKTETSLNLLNASQPGGSMNSYNNITGTLAASGGSIIAGEGFTAEELGYRGWIGKTYSAKIYKNQFGTNDTPTLDFVPAKSVATGMIGMFDQAEGVFYPLLGIVDLASVGNLSGVRTKRADNSWHSLSASNAAELASVIGDIQSGETVYMLKDIDVDGDVTIPVGVTLDLGGHRLSAANVTADSTQSAYIIDHTYEGGVTVSGTFSYGAGHEDYHFATSDSKVYTVKSNWVTRLAKAKSGEVIKLTEMLEDDRDFVLGEDAILDLNGLTMKVKSFDASKGQVIDSTLDIQNSTENDKVNFSKGKVIVAEGEEFKFAATNPLVVIDNKDNTYNFRKLAVTYLPGSATGWTLAAPSFDAGTSRYIEYWNYGETITLAKMVYTADGAYISWVRDDASFTPGAKYATAITEDIEFSTELKLADVDGKAYLSWADAVAAIKNNSSVTIYGNVKLTEDLKNSTVAFILAENATLDLDGHKFAYKTVDTKAIGSRIIDSATGTYEFYDYLYTNGTEFITTGVSSLTVSGIKATFTMDQPYPDTGNRHLFGGYYTGKTDRLQFIATDGQDAANKGSAVNNTSGIRGGWLSNSAGGAEVAVTADGYKIANGVESINNLNKKFNVDVHIDANGFSASFSGAHTKSGSKTNGLFDRSTKTQFNMMLLNMSNTSYSNMTQVGAQWADYANDQTGRIGWVGKTYSASIYENEVGGNVTATHDFIPAKSVATGMIGMFDQVEGVFYPLLGKTEYAQMGNFIDIRTKRADNSWHSLSASDAAELASVIGDIQSGETIIMLANITVDGDVTIPAGVSLDLNGHRLSAANVTADSTQSAYIVDRTYEGGVTVRDTFSYGAGHEDYRFTTSDNKAYTIKANWVTRLAKAKSGEIIKLTEMLEDDRDFVLGEGAILDLNGLTMKVKSLDVSKGYVTDSLLKDVKDSTSENNDPFSEGKVITDTFKWADTNPLKVIDNHDGSYSFRKYILQYFPGEATGWTLDGTFDANSKYIEYCDYGEVNLPSMIYTSYTADNASAVWAFPGYTVKPGDPYTVIGDMDFTVQFSAVVPGGTTTTENGTITVSGETYSSWDAAAVKIKDNSKVTIDGTVKLTADATNDTVTYTLGDNATLDLNGHKFAYKAVNTETSVGARVIDSKAGNYEFYDYLFTNGRQAIPTGLTPADVTGFYAKTRLERVSVDTGPMVLFGGFVQPKSGSQNGKTLRFMWSTNQQNANTKGVFAPTTTSVYGGWFTPDAGDPKSTKSQAWINIDKDGVEQYGFLSDPDSYLTIDTVVRDGYQSTSFGGSVGDQPMGSALSATLYDRNEYSFGLNLLNISGTAQGIYSNWTKKCDYQWDQLADQEQGRNGWYGKTYSAKIYSSADPQVTENKEADLIRDFIPAKSVETGMIGMFDQVEGVFYPLLGVVDLASVGNLSGMWFSAIGEAIPEDSYDTTEYGAKIQDDETRHTYLVEKASFFTDAAFDGIASGDTIVLGNNITFNKDLTLPEGVTLDLNGYDLRVSSLDADQEGTVLKDRTMTNAAVFSSGELKFNKDESTYYYHEVSGGVYLCRRCECTTENEFELLMLNAIEHDVIILGSDIECRRTSLGYTMPDGIALDTNGHKIRYYVRTPQALANVLSISNEFCTICLDSDNFTEEKDFYAVPDGVTVLYNGHEFSSKFSTNAKPLEDGSGFVGKGDQSKSTLTPASSLVSKLLSSSGIVKLEEDITDNRDYVLGANVVLDLNGHNLRCKSFDGRNGGVIDSAKNGGHTITVKDTEKTKFRSDDPADTMANLHHYEVSKVSDDQTVYTFSPYKITYRYSDPATGKDIFTVREKMRGQTTLARSDLFSASLEWFFVKWNTAENFTGKQYDAGSVFNLAEDTVLYAQFTKYYFEDDDGYLHCFDKLEEAMEEAAAAGKVLNVVGNTAINSDLQLLCNLTVSATLTIKAKFDLNGKTLTITSGTLTGNGTIYDSTNGKGKIITADGVGVKTAADFVEITSADGSTHRYFEVGNYFNADSENTKIMTDPVNHPGKSALVFGLSESFQENIGAFLNDSSTKIKVHLKLTDKERFNFCPDNIVGSKIPSKGVSKNTYVVEFDWDITDLLKAEIVNKTPENIYALLKNCSGSLEINEAYIIVEHSGNKLLNSSSLNNLA